MMATRLYEIRYTNQFGIDQLAVVSSTCTASFLSRLESEGSVLRGMRRICGGEV